MEMVLILAAVAGGALLVTLLLRHVIRKAAFRVMTFKVNARGRTFAFHRERFWDERGRPVTDPALLAELEAEWRAIEQRTAMDTHL